jgi:hypothetical protein|tara:strand:- start:689 stop:1003 length:315 start_codon:yes stop_codon:yes gene_type:complete
VAPALLSALRSRSSLPTKASPTSPSVVLRAVKPERTSAAVHRVALVATAIKEEKCIPLSAPLVAKIPRYPSSQEKGDPCIAVNVTLKLEPNPTTRNKKRKERLI